MKKSLIIILIALSSFSSFALTSLSSIRSMYSGVPLVLPVGTVITGTIISDRSNINTAPAVAFLQDNTGGISVRFTSVSPFNLNDSVVIDVSGDTLDLYNGLLEIDHVDLLGASMVGTGSIAPQVATIADVLNNMITFTDTWESTLVTINNVFISNTSTGIYSGNDTIYDATGQMVLYTRPLATFSNAPLPTGLVNITGYITEFFIPEIIIRGLYDVQVVSSVPENEKNGTYVKLFPNPAADHITINLAESNKKTMISIFNASLQEVYTATAESGKNIDVSTKKFAAGIYTVQVQSADKIETKKLIVAR